MPGTLATLRTAYEDHETVVRLTQDLVRIPSRGGIDPYGPVLECMASWLVEHGLPCQYLAGAGGTTVALTSEIRGAGPGPHYVLDACLDTAPFGDENAWTRSPTSGEIIDGWLHGRGSSDSKAGAAIFAHVAARLQQTADQWSGRVALLFDVDEHTGAFGGAKAYFENARLSPVSGVMIGYPGLDHVVTGGRGVLRARIHVHGIAGHSGARKINPSAIAKAAALISHLTDEPLPGPPSQDFPLPGKLTITAINGGEGYSAVPDLCTFNVDVRLTPALDEQAALNLLQTAIVSIDIAWPGTRPTHVEVITHWPAFALGEDEPLRAALLEAARSAGALVTAKVAGPSNIGNYLAGLGISATAGFGVDYRGLHGTDEQIALNSIPLVQAVYHQALLSLLNPS